MKQITFVFLLSLFSSFCIHAQGNLAIEYAMWSETHTTLIGPQEHVFALCGDTIIDGEEYLKLFDFQPAINEYDRAYMGGIRGDGAVTYYKSHLGTDEFVLFDFSLEAGDSIELMHDLLASPITRHVDSTRFEDFNGSLRKVIYFAPGSAGAPVEFWVEGAGSSYGLLGRAVDPGGDLGFSLNCVAAADSYINFTPVECFLPAMADCAIVNSIDEKYENLHVSIFPNPAYGEINIEIEGGFLFPIQVELYHTDGGLARVFSDIYGGNISLDISRQNGGLYFLKIINSENGEAVFFGKIIKL